VNLQYGEV
jgi:hypothetical protein